MKRVLSVVGALLFFSGTTFLALAEDTSEAPPARGGDVRIQFVPPPMDGTISLGVYDGRGKLVRVLKREATARDFTVALNGLITTWDGRDDSGAKVPAGTYSARGFLVGEFEIEGEAFAGNDWIDDDEGSPRIQRVNEIFALPNGGFGISAQGPKGILKLGFDPSGKPIGDDVSEPQKTLVLRDGKIFRKGEEGSLAIDVENPIAVCNGRNGGVWVIDQRRDGIDVEEFSERGEFQRRLPIKKGEPVPVQIAASPRSDQIFLLEEDSNRQRVRSLALVGTEPDSPSAKAPVSTWKVVFEKAILFSDRFDRVRRELKMPDGSSVSARDKVTVTLRANPLEQGKPGKAEVAAGIDGEGSFLKLTDGLPLAQLTDTPHLKWAVLAGEPKDGSITVFQSDGAIIEQYRVSKIAEMMAFDCGDFDYDPAAEK